MNLERAARVLVETCVHAEPGSEVCVVIDDHASSPLVAAIRRAVNSAGGRPTVVQYAPEPDRPLHKYCLFAGASLRETTLQPVVSAALRVADAAIILTNDMDSMFASDLADLLRAGLRAIYLPYLTTEGAARMLPTSPDEAMLLSDEVRALGRRFEQAREARVISPGGTNLALRLGQWRVRTHLGIVDDTGLQVLPAGQVTHVPDDGTANGTLVIDRSIADHDYREVRDPIVITIEAGQATSFSGGRDADRTAAFLRSLNDPNAYHLTELAIGVNPRCVLTGSGAPAEDTHMRGTVSLALGCDVHIGGGTRAKTHIDMTMWGASLAMDSDLVVEGGVLAANHGLERTGDG